MARTTPVNEGYSIINGSVTGTNGSKVDTWIEWKVISTSVANNTSNVRIILYAQATTSLSTNYDSTENYGWVGYDNGNKNWMSKSGYDFRNKALITFGDHTFTISHNSDGTKTLTIQGGWSTNGHSSYIKDGSVSRQVTLPRIARASTISSLSTNLGSAGTISITRQSSDFTHTLTYTFGSASGTIVTKTSNTSVSWTPDVSLIAQFGANDKTKTGTITCTTYSGNTSVGTSTRTLTLTIPNSSLGNVSGTFGSALTLTASNACASGLTYTFAYYNGSSWQSIASTSNKTQSWTPATSLIANVSNASTGTFNIRVITYRGSTAINTATATATLTIPKNTSSAVSGTIGSAVSISITKAHSNLTSTITYAFGSASGTIATKTTSTSQSWTPPTSLLTQIPNSTSGTGSITITTYNGTASCGSNTYTLTLSAATSVVPTSALSLAMVNNNSTVAGWGIYLQGYSQVTATLTGSGVSGSTIKSMAISGTGLSSSSSYSTTSATLTGTSSVLTTSGTLTYKGNISDSRNRSATEKSQSISVVAYSQPSVSNVSLARSNSSGTIDTSGTYLKVGFTLNYSSASGHNSASVSLRYKETSASSWTTYGVVTNGANLNLNLDVSKNYQAQLLVSDALNSNIQSATITIPSAERVLNVNGSGSGLAIGGFSTDAGKLQVYYPTIIDDLEMATGQIRKFDSRQESANLTRESQGGMSHFLATSTMTEGKPPYDSHIIQMDWDNANGGDTQLAIRNNNPLGMWIRTNGASSYASKWFPVGHQVTDNSQFLIEGTSAQICNIGDGFCIYSKSTYGGSHPELLPDNYGILEFHGSGSDWYEIWHTQPQGHLYYRGGNGSYQPTSVAWTMIPSWDDIAVKVFNDTSGADWKEMLKNKVDYVRTYGMSGKTYIMQGGWAGQTYGYSIIYWTNSYVVCDFYGLSNRHWRCVYNGSSYSYYRLSEDGSNDYTYNGLTIRARRKGSSCSIYVSGTPTSTIATGSAYVDIVTDLPEMYRPSLGYVNYIFFSGQIGGQLNVTTAGVVRIGYTRRLYDNATIDLSSTCYARITYEVQ